MSIKSRFFLVVGLLLSFMTNTLSQTSEHAIVSQISASRFIISHNMGYELQWSKNVFGAYAGYNPDRLLRFNYFSSNVKSTYRRTLIENGQISVAATLDFIGSFGVYPENKSMNLYSFYGGYTFLVGKRWQFTHALSLGISQFTASGFKNPWVQDFQLMLGCRYRLNYVQE